MTPRGLRLSSDDYNERLRAAMRRLKAEKFDDNESALARALGMRDQSNVHRFLEGTQGTSLEVAEKVAELMGTTVVELLGLPPGHKTPIIPRRFRDHPDWPEVERRVRASRHGHRFVDEAYTLAGDAMGGKMPAVIDDVFMIQLLEVWQRVVDDPDGTGAAEDAEIEKVHERDRARHRLPAVANETDEPAGEPAGKTGRTKKGLAAGAEQDASPTPPTTDKPKSGTRPKRRQ